MIDIGWTFSMWWCEDIHCSLDGTLMEKSHLE